MKAGVEWAAGFFEGEGDLSIDFSQSRNGYGGRVSASQSVREPLDRLVELFGGKVYQRKLDGNYFWTLNCKNALPFLEQIHPYIVSPLRRKEISVYTAFWNTTDRDVRNSLLEWWRRRK